MPPKAKAKGVAAKAKAKAAFAGKAKAQSAGLAKGRGAGPQGTLPPSGPAPVATRRWVHCGWDADYAAGKAKGCVAAGMPTSTTMRWHWRFLAK